MNIEAKWRNLYNDTAFRLGLVRFLEAYYGEGTSVFVAVVKPDDPDAQEGEAVGLEFGSGNLDIIRAYLENFLDRTESEVELQANIVRKL